MFVLTHPIGGIHEKLYILLFPLKIEVFDVIFEPWLRVASKYMQYLWTIFL